MDSVGPSAELAERVSIPSWPSPIYQPLMLIYKFAECITKL